MARVPGLLLVVVDCLRADLFDPPRRAWPIASRLLESGASFASAYTTCPTTTPAFAALLTGRLPSTHGVRALRGARLSEDVPTLAEEFARAGRRTWASVTGPLLNNVGILRGFEEVEYRDVPERSVHSPWGRRLLERVRTDAAGDGNWLGLVHLWDMHTPRTYPRRFDERRFGRTTYERSLAGVDPWLGQLLDAAGPETTVVFTGDHGENVNLEPRTLRQQAISRRIHRLPVKAWAARTVERGGRSESKRLLRIAPRYFWNHSQTLFERDVRVPLAFAGPSVAAGTWTTPVSHVDVAPTLLELAGLPGDVGAPPSTSLAPSVREGREPPPHPVVMETATGAPGGIPTIPHHAIRDGRWKLLTSLERTAAFADALYDLPADPRERRNVAREHGEVVERLKAKLRELTAERSEAGAMSAEDDAALEQRLEELGYL